MIRPLSIINVNGGVAPMRSKGLGEIWAGVNQIYPPARGTSARQETNTVTDPSKDMVTALGLGGVASNSASDIRSSARARLRGSYRSLRRPDCAKSAFGLTDGPGTCRTAFLSRTTTRSVSFVMVPSSRAK